VVREDAFVYRALGLMSELNIRHLAVIDETGYVVGALSARDLLRLRASEALTLGAQIERAGDVHALALAWARLPHASASLKAEGVPARDIAAVISRELGALTRQAAIIAEGMMREHGHGDPPCSYGVAVLGSAGRDESLLAADQDNALFFARGEEGGSEDRWFAEFGVHMTAVLNQAGLPYCRGGVMASSPQWRGSAATWRTRIGDWISRSDPADLLSVDIFFDLRGVHGDVALINGLRHEAFDAAHRQVVFAKLLAAAPGGFESGLTFLGRFRTTRGRIDLKKYGSFAVVTAARALSVRNRLLVRSTPERLAAVRGLGIGGGHDLDALADAHDVFLELILAQQIADVDHGTPASSAVLVNRLSLGDRDRLRRALGVVPPLEGLLRDLLFAH
jgi:CBS domain-containing protein